jgi:HD superfamily phosphohydrolase
MVQPRTRSAELSEVTDFLDEKYVIESEIDSGGSGIVFRGHKAHDPDLHVAIKFYVIPAQASFLAETTFKVLILPDDEEVFETEFQFLRKTRHPGVQELISFGILSDAERYFEGRSDILLPKGGRIRFLVSRFIDGSRFREWLRGSIEKVNVPNGKISPREARMRLCRVLFEVADTLAYIHDVRQYQHSDLRSENILIHHDSGRPIIVDFGYAHCFDPKIQKGYTQLHHIPDSLPDALREELRKLLAKAPDNRIPREALRAVVFPGLDLYNLGQLLEEVLATPRIGTILTIFDQQFLHLIARRLTEWRTAKTSRAVEVAKQLRKLETGLGVPGQTTSPEVEKRVALPSGGLNLTGTMIELLNTRAFRRLQLLNQLSFVNQIYPGASQSRFEHSLAVYVTTSRLVASLSRSPRFRLLFDEAGVLRLLLVALLHDINHFPFLHYFQELDIPALKRVNVLDLFCNGVATSDKPSIYEILQNEGLSPEYFKAVLFEDYEDLMDPQMQVIRSIIDSGVDVDKLTYVRDDARFTGVPFGSGVDFDAIFEHADIGQFRSERTQGRRYRYHLCFKPAALSGVESLLMARFWNFRQIYWHRTNRAIGSMITHVIARVFEDGTSSFEEFLVRSIGRTESGTLMLLNEMYRDKYGEDSIIADLGSRRAHIFKRLISIKAGWQATSSAPTESKLFTDLSKLSQNARQEFLEELRKELEKLFRGQLGDLKLGSSDLLLDVPGRPLDEQLGAVHICELNPDGREKLRVGSPFIEQLLHQFAALSRTIRVYLAPEIRDKFGEDRISARREEIQGAILAALKKVRGVPDMYK